MRTTIDIEDDALQAAREVAAHRRASLGKVVSDLIRKALEPGPAPAVRNGVPLLPARPAVAATPTMDLVNDLRDEA